jgi:hypothetical protein
MLSAPREKTLGEWLDEVADRVARDWPTPLELPEAVRATRAALGLPESDHLVLTTNHAATTPAPWQMARLMVAEGLVERLRARGVAAHSLVTPLDHNTLGEANRPGILFLGGRGWAWPGLPKETRRVVCRVEVTPPPEAWWERIQATLLQDAGKAWRQGRAWRGKMPRREFQERAGAAFQSVRALMGTQELAGRADGVWTRLQEALTRELGFETHLYRGMAEVERALATSAPLAETFAERLVEALRVAGPGADGEGDTWREGFFWFLCPQGCGRSGSLQMARLVGSGMTHEGTCTGCGTTRRWSWAEALEALASGDFHPRVHLLVCWLRRGLAPILHTCGPQMVLYAPLLEKVEEALGPEEGLPPQQFVAVGCAIPAVVLSPRFLALLPKLQEVGGQARGADLWRRVVRAWAEAAGWEVVERRLGPRLRNGGFPPAVEGEGILESALRAWDWWPPADPLRRRGGSLDSALADLADGLTAWSQPFLWGGGWDWYFAGIRAGEMRQRFEETALPRLHWRDDAPPGPLRAPVLFPTWCDGEEIRRQQEKLWSELMTDP